MPYINVLIVRRVLLTENEVIWLWHPNLNSSEIIIYTYFGGTYVLGMCGLFTLLVRFTQYSTFSELSFDNNIYKFNFVEDISVTLNNMGLVRDSSNN